MTMSEKRHKINKDANNQNTGVIMRNNPAFDRHGFVPSQTVDLWCTNLLPKPLMIGLQVSENIVLIPPME